MTGEGFIQIPGFDWKHPPFAGDDRCAAQELTDRSAIQCGRHDEQAQVRTEEPLRFEAESQAGVSLKAAFMKLVKEDDAIAAERGILLEQSGQNPFGHNFDAGFGTDLRVQPHAIADGIAGTFIERRRHTMGGGPGCQAPGLQHEDLLALEPGGLQEGQRHAGGLAGSRWGGQEPVGGPNERVAEVRKDIFYWEPRHDRVQPHVEQTVTDRVGKHERIEEMAGYQWTLEKPRVAGWYWFRGAAHEADPFIVEVDQVGQFQWPDGGYQEVALAKGEWAGPIQLPEDD